MENKIQEKRISLQDRLIESYTNYILDSLYLDCKSEELKNVYTEICLPQVNFLIKYLVSRYFSEKYIDITIVICADIKIIESLNNHGKLYDYGSYIVTLANEKNNVKDVKKYIILLDKMQNFIDKKSKLSII